MIKIAIFENEFVEVESAFKAVNLIYYQNSLEFKVFYSSQEIGDITNVKNYSVVFVDLDLSLKSRMDGYQLINRILSNDSNAKIIILSGASEENITEKLLQKNLPKLEIINKPIDFDDIYDKLKKYVPIP